MVWIKTCLIVCMQLSTALTRLNQLGGHASLIYRLMLQIFPQRWLLIIPLVNYCKAKALYTVDYTFEPSRQSMEVWLQLGATSW